MKVKIKECPFCHNKPNVYPFIAQLDKSYEPKFLFKHWYLLKCHTKEIPVLWTVECSEWCDDWMNEYNKKENIIATKTKEEAIAKWNKWIGEITHDNSCRH